MARPGYLRGCFSWFRCQGSADPFSYVAAQRLCRSDHWHDDVTYGSHVENGGLWISSHPPAHLSSSDCRLSALHERSVVAGGDHDCLFRRRRVRTTGFEAPAGLFFDQSSSLLPSWAFCLGTADEQRVIFGQREHSRPSCCGL